MLIHPAMAVYSGSLAKGPAAGGSLDRWQPLLWAVTQAAEHVSNFKPFSIHVFNCLSYTCWIYCIWIHKGIYEGMVWHSVTFWSFCFVACIWNQWTICRCWIVNKFQANRGEKDWSWSFLTGKGPALKNFASIGWKCLFVLAMILVAMFPFAKFHSSLNAFSIGVSPACSLHKDVHRMHATVLGCRYCADIFVFFCWRVMWS